MKIYETIQAEVDRIKSLLDIRDTNAISTMEALEWALSVMEPEKELYHPSKAELPPVVAYNSGPIQDYTVGSMSFEVDLDEDVEEIEAYIRSLQAWRLFLLNNKFPEPPNPEEAEDA